MFEIIGYNYNYEHWSVVNMSFLSYKVNKKTNTTYVYEVTSYWDKNEKKVMKHQTCIGKLDPITKELIASKKIQKTLCSKCQNECEHASNKK